MSKCGSKNGCKPIKSPAPRMNRKAPAPVIGANRKRPEPIRK